MRGPYLLHQENKAGLRELFRKIGCEPPGEQIMSKKGEIIPLLLKEVRSPGANILKQQMLSLGGEAAVSRGVVNCSQEQTDVLLLGTLTVYEGLVNKLAQQPWGLSALREKIKNLLAQLEDSPREIVWEWPDRRLVIGKKVLVMGILNVTPDSFSDGGKYLEMDKALAHARQMVADGADLLDVGGESTRPGHTIVSAEEELARVLPILERLRREFPVPVSLDTSKAQVAAEALATGVELINYEGVGDSKQMAEVVGRYQAPVIIMHNPHLGNTAGHMITDAASHMEDDSTHLGVNNAAFDAVRNAVCAVAYDDVIPDLIDGLEQQIGIFEAAGVPPEKILVDPGIGFGKSQQANLLVLKRLESLRTLGKPVLLGVSRKSFLGNILKSPAGERLEGSLAAAAWGMLHGADVLRVHDVRETVRLAKVLEAIRQVHDGGQEEA